VSKLLAKIAPNTTSVQANQVKMPASFKLEQSYPNLQSFNHHRVSSSGGKYVTLKIYDMLGKEIATLVNERKSPGAYRVNFDASGLADGVYFYRLQAGQSTQTRKLMLLR
jgi:hypothetical protein